MLNSIEIMSDCGSEHLSRLQTPHRLETFSEIHGSHRISTTQLCYLSFYCYVKLGFGFRGEAVSGRDAIKLINGFANSLINDK